MLCFIAHLPLSCHHSPPPLLSRRPFLPLRSPSHLTRPHLHMCTPSPPTESTPVQEVPFEIRGFSLANAFLFAGGVVSLVSFSSYFNSNGTASASSLGFVYGVPILLIGCALKYAELQPIEVTTSPSAEKARKEKATETQKKIFSDITRHRYGDEAHLSSALSALGLIPRGEACPELIRGEEKEVDGEYCLKLIFYSVATPWREWTNKIEKYEQFFGPGVQVEVQKEDSEKRLVAMIIKSGKKEKGEAPQGSAVGKAENIGG